MSAELSELTSKMLDLPQVECPVRHQFAPGVYLREIFIPAGTFIVGHKHKTEHFCIVLKGRLRVLIDGKVVEIAAPYSFVSKAGAQRAAYVMEDTIWQTIHPTDETDIDALEALLVEPSQEKLPPEQRKALIKP